MKAFLCKPWFSQTLVCSDREETLRSVAEGHGKCSSCPKNYVKAGTQWHNDTSWRFTPSLAIKFSSQFTRTACSFENLTVNVTLSILVSCFWIQRSLKRKWNVCDNAIAEATFKAFKIKLIYQNKSKMLKELGVQLKDYINWFNYHRLHGSLDYLSPVDYRLQYST
jgi:transposase InsO family protein